MSLSFVYEFLGLNKTKVYLTWNQVALDFGEFGAERNSQEKEAKSYFNLSWKWMKWFFFFFLLQKVKQGKGVESHSEDLNLH